MSFKVFLIFSYFEPDYPKSGLTVTGLARVYYTCFSGVTYQEFTDILKLILHYFMSISQPVTIVIMLELLIWAVFCMLLSALVRKVKRQWIPIYYYNTFTDFS
jgi:hypothetical protein